MTKCKHDIAEQDTYVADGYCPLCLLDQIREQQDEIERLMNMCRHWKIAEATWDKDRVEALETRVAELEGALRKLRNESAGTLGMPGIRELIGNTNYACLELRITEAEQALGERDD